MSDTFQRLRTILTSTGISRSTIYLRISQGVFTKPVLRRSRRRLACKRSCSVKCGLDRRQV